MIHCDSFFLLFWRSNHHKYHLWLAKAESAFYAVWENHVFSAIGYKILWPRGYKIKSENLSHTLIQRDHILATRCPCIALRSHQLSYTLLYDPTRYSGSSAILSPPPRYPITHALFYTIPRYPMRSYPLLYAPILSYVLPIDPKHHLY